MYPGLDAVDCKRSDFGDKKVGECFCGENNPELCGCLISPICPVAAVKIYDSNTDVSIFTGTPGTPSNVCIEEGQEVTVVAEYATAGPGGASCMQPSSLYMTLLKPSLSDPSDTRLERVEPFALYGNNHDNLFGRNIPGGNYVLVVVPDGKPSEFFTFHFTLNYDCQDPDCSPTSGECASTSDKLQELLDAAVAGDTVSICEGATLSTESAITASTPSLTLCCKGGAKDCTIESKTGNNQNLLVEVPDSHVKGYTINGISFLNGNSGSVGGGNVRLVGSGDHQLNDCRLVDGTTDRFGGNLYVDAGLSGSISLFNSSFSNGSANRAGGGVFVEKSGVVTVSNSHFTNNHAESVGGLYTGTSTNYDPQDVLIESSSFTGNTANRLAAGFYMGFTTALGDLSTLSILNTSFDDNIVIDADQWSYSSGGAGTIGAQESLKSVDVVLSGNSGSGNSAVCDGFLIRMPGSETDCVAVDENFVY